MDKTPNLPPAREGIRSEFSHAEQFRRHIEDALQNVGSRVLMLTTAAAVLQMLTLALESTQPWALRLARMSTSAAVLTLCLACGLLKRRWGMRAAMAAFCVSTSVTLLAAAYFHGIGLRSSGMPGLLLIVLLAAFLSGRRVMWTVTLGSAGGIVLLGLAQEAGWISGPTPANTPPVGSFIVVYLTVLLLCAWLVVRFSAIFWQATNSLQASHELLVQSMRSQQTSSDELRRSEQRLRSLLDGALFGIQIVDAETAELRYANDQALLTFGCVERSELEPSLMGMGRDSDRAVFLDRVRKAAREGVQQFAWQARRKDGAPLWLDLKLDRLDFNGEVQVVIFIHDVSARAEAEAELRQHRERLQEEVIARTAEQRAERQKMQEIIEALPITLSVRSPAGRYMMVNRYFEQTVGRSRDEILGRPLKDLFDPEYSRGMLKRDERVLADGQPITVEEQILHPQEGRRDYLTTTVPLTDQRGRPYAVLNLGTDVTMLKTLQRELSTARDEAQASSKAKGDFLANMSHEIRTPLNAMLGLAQLGRRGDTQPALARQAFERILRAGRHLQGVIDDVLDYTRIESGKLPVELLPVRLAALVKDAMDLVSERAQEKGLALTWTSEGVPIGVLLDPLRVSQVLVNLLANAIKFTERGEVSVHLGRSEEQLIIRIVDTGPGIAKEHQERIFHAFEQADSSTTRKYGGSGLGLAISRKQVEGMGGTLTVDSEPGRGATFIVSLPLQEAALPQGSADGRGVEPDLSGLRILVVDDVDINREILRDMLGSFGIETVQAASGEEALQQVRQRGPEAFDLVLMDVQMPRMDGYEAAAALRQLTPELPMVAVTAHAMAEHRKHSLEAGMRDHLTKPVDIDVLRDCIVRILRPEPSDRQRSPSMEMAAEPLASGGEESSAKSSAKAQALAAAGSSPGVGGAGAAVVTVTELAEARPGGDWPDLPDCDFPAALRRCAGQLPLLHKLLRQFVRHYEQHETLFEAALAAGPQALQSAAHRLKGAAGNLGLNGLSMRAAALERACAEPSSAADIEAALQTLGRALATHLSGLSPWLPPEEPAE